MDDKKCRTQFDQTEKTVFWSIVKTEQDGKIWKTIMESKNNTARRDAWRVVAQAFANHIGKDFSALQAKELFKRMKISKKKEHDKRAIDREYKKACSGTGGGPSPNPPSSEDGDDMDDCNMDDFEPVRTEFNVLVQPGDREFFSLGAATSTPRNSMGTKSNRRILGQLNLYNRPSLSSPATQPTSKSASEDFEQSISCAGFPAVDGAVKELQSHAGFDINVGGSSIDEQNIIISDGNGNIKKVRAEKNKERVIQRKEKIKAPKKSMNDEAVNYYSSLSRIQTKLMKQKVKFYKRKENVEILKQKLLEASIIKEGLSIPVMNRVESSDTSGSDGTDSD